ncbi:hypothetical protein ACFYXF_24240 [Streptomyces sp. NPDC002680]|uniref:hypothetical protein n=1 Tax=Streptomyces sp. NPDC002680 TaxID=3364659 RepID=UPI003681D5AA
MRKKAGAGLASVLLAMAAVVATVAGTGTASAAPVSGRAAFVTEAHGAGLSDKQPRQLGDVGILAEGFGSTECIGGADYGWFCAYSGPNFTGERLGIYRCGVTWNIPWVSVGSWDNNQTAGTRPLLTFTNGSTWLMPAAHSIQPSGVDWAPVRSIRAC